MENLETKTEEDNSKKILKSLINVWRYVGRTLIESSAVGTFVYLAGGDASEESAKFGLVSAMAYYIGRLGADAFDATYFKKGRLYRALKKD